MCGMRRGITCSMAALAESARAKLLQNGAISLNTIKVGMLDTFNSLGVHFISGVTQLRIILSLYAETNVCNVLQREGHASQSKGKCLSIER
jgi:hypothetical protein